MSIMTLLLITVEAEESNDKKTLLFVSSTDDDWFERGNSYFYSENEADFFWFFNDELQQLQIGCRTKDKHVIGETWLLEIKPPRGQRLVKGVYLDTNCFLPDNKPKLRFLDSRGENVNGDFEILELEWDENNKITSLAINFNQYCQKKELTHLFGCVRYNSSIPAVASVSDLVGKKVYVDRSLLNDKSNIVFYYTKHEAKKRPQVAVSHIGMFDYSDNVDVIYLNNDNRLALFICDRSNDLVCLLEFIEKEEVVNELFDLEYDDDQAKIYRGEIKTNIQDLKKVTLGDCVISQLVKDGEGNILKLAFDFRVENSNIDYTEGSFRYNSEIPIKLTKPFSG